MSMVVSVLLGLVAQQTVSGHTREVWSLGASNDGQFFASGSTDLTVKVWAGGTGKPVRTIEGFDGAVLALAFSPDSKWLAAGEMYKKVRVYSTSDWALGRTLDDIEGAVTGLAWSTDGKWLAASCRDNVVRFWDMTAETTAKVAKFNWEVNGVAAKPVGGMFAVVDGNGTLTALDGDSMAPVFEAKHGDKASSVAFSPDGSVIATGGGDHPVRMWSSEDGSPMAEFKSPVLDANSLCFSPDGSVLVVGTQDNFVVVLDSKSGTVKSKTEAHERPVTAVAFGPDGKWYVTGSQDYKLKLWKR